MKRIGTAPVPAARGLETATDWDLAACRQVDPDLHHPLSEHRVHRQQIAHARLVCADCPLTGPDGPCLQRALDAEAGTPLDHRSGVYAGTTPSQRHHLDKETV